jgi:hypothetical protein
VDIETYIVGGALVVVFALLELLYKTLEKQIDTASTNLIDSIDSLRDEMTIGLNAKQAKEHCTMQTALFKGEYEHLKEIIGNTNLQNTKEHGDLIDTQDKIIQAQKETSKELANVSKCLTLLSANLPCKDV